MLMYADGLGIRPVLWEMASAACGGTAAEFVLLVRRWTQYRSQVKRPGGHPGDWA
ncbi:hypothetical protein ACFYY1_39500 [Streptomyces sp. NPDC001890]|uniref:hypothetical protein n=1 Tax=Streptomyces sp. NPDC001890 TaxID=3364620 RepID=UPI00368C536D